MAKLHEWMKPIFFIDFIHYYHVKTVLIFHTQRIAILDKSLSITYKLLRKDPEKLEDKALPFETQQQMMLMEQ